MSRERQKGERLIDIDGETWGWKITKSTLIVFRPDRKKSVISTFAVGEIDFLSIVVKPSHVEKYIRLNLLKDWKND